MHRDRHVAGGSATGLSFPDQKPGKEILNLYASMKRKYSPKFRVFSARCPKCGGTDTKLDLTATENLKLVPLTAVTTVLTLPGLGTAVRMTCCACKVRFLG